MLSRPCNLDALNHTFIIVMSNIATLDIRITDTLMKISKDQIIISAATIFMSNHIDQVYKKCMITFLQFRLLDKMMDKNLVPQEKMMVCNFLYFRLFKQVENFH